MPTNVIMPQMGESIAEGTITKWMKKVGERVDRDEPLFEISTDKVDAEIPSPAAGVLTQILVKENETVAVNTVVAVVDGEGAGVATPHGDSRRRPQSRSPPLFLPPQLPRSPLPAAATQAMEEQENGEGRGRSHLASRPAHCSRAQCGLERGEGHGIGRPSQQERHPGFY